MNSKPKSKELSPQKKVMQESAKKLEESKIIAAAKKTNDQYVDFQLPNAKGKMVTLSEQLKKGPVVLSFYRGGWCPYCNLQLHEYQSRLEDIKKAGGQLIAISPETPKSAQDTIAANEINFEVLSDDQNQIARQYGLVFHVDDNLKEVYLKFGINLEKNQGNGSWELPIPATYVIDPNGKIIYAFLNTDYKVRAEPDEIIRALNSIKAQN